MARKRSPQLTSRGSGPRRGSNMGTNITLVLVAIPLIFIFMPTVLFLAFAMLPTFVAMIVDKGVKRYGGITVGGLNFAGASPFLMELWMGGHTIQHALTILSDVFALMLIFGTAAFGWLLYSATPTIVTAIMSMTSTRRVTALRAKQRELIQEWGPEVAHQEVTEEPEDSDGGDED